MDINHVFRECEECDEGIIELEGAVPCNCEKGYWRKLMDQKPEFQTNQLNNYKEGLLCQIVRWQQKYIEFLEEKLDREHNVLREDYGK